MNKSKFLFAIALFSICLLSFSNTFGQTNNDRVAGQNYEIVLQTLTPIKDSSNRNAIPSNLLNTVTKLKKNFSFSDYSLAETHFGRTGDGGNIEYKGVTKSSDGQIDKSPVFNEWTLIGLNKEASSSNTVSIKSFRFGSRVPVSTSNVINYEQVGISIQKFNIRENEPTIIGTLTLPNENQIAFIVLTVKPVE